MSSNTVVALASAGWKPTAGRPASEVGSSERRRRRAFEMRSPARSARGSSSTKSVDDRGIERAAGFLLQQQRAPRRGVIALWYGRSEVSASK